MQRIPPPVRFVIIVVALVLIFGSCGSLTLGALDKVQTQSPGSLFNPVTLMGNVWHFLQETLRTVTTATDRNNVPLRNYFLSGLGLTVQFCFIAMPLAIVFGLVLALMSRSKYRVLRVPTRAYVEFFRNTPLLVQMLAIYWGLLSLPAQLLNPFTAGVATLVLNYAAYECENIRAGLAAVDRGQGEAAESLGMGFFQSLRHVILPQTMAIVLPPILNDLIYLFKDSSILSLITITELTAQSTGLGRRIPDHFWEFIVVGGLIYLGLSLPLARLARVAEAQLRSVTFVPKVDPLIATLEVLGVSTLVGMVAGILVQGLSLGSILGEVGQWFAGVGLTLLIMFFVLGILGGIVYGVSTLFTLGRQRESRRTPRSSSPVAIVSK